MHLLVGALFSLSQVLISRRAGYGIQAWTTDKS
jgi:hypothetical protein